MLSKNSLNNYSFGKEEPEKGSSQQGGPGGQQVGPGGQHGPNQGAGAGRAILVNIYVAVLGSQQEKLRKARSIYN